jgi:4-hydroxybenzoate polyprenyl transferase
MINQLNLFIELVRLKKPIGFMLLFWPCSWGLTIAYDFNQDLEKYFWFLLLFLVGAILMRSAGCIINDIVDSDFDKKVERTKNRPIASGKISKIKAFTYAMVLCGIAFLVLIQFNNFTILMALLSMPLAFTYPLMKRFTYWPQLFLGITFNYGLVLAWISITNEISIIPVIFYLGAIFWTLGYDTIYGFQDIKDDEIIGVKSASIKFKNEPKKILFFSYFFFVTSLLFMGILMDFKIQYFLFLSIPMTHLILQVKKLNISLPDVCLKIFKSNNFLGLLILMNILIGKLL